MTTLCKVVCFHLIILTLALATEKSDESEFEWNLGECIDSGRCSQICVDSVNCSCISGFKLSNNNSCTLLGEYTITTIAYDWIGDQIYFTDWHHIAVCSADFLFCSILIPTKTLAPTCLALDPNHGLMFWSPGRGIMRAEMDGSNPIEISKDHEVHGMTIDTGNSRIYWTDYGLIESARLDGSDRKNFRPQGLGTPFSIDVIGDKLVWCDLLEPMIKAGNKFDDSDLVTLFNESTTSKDGFLPMHLINYDRIVISHVANQPIRRNNPCKDAGCSHFCVIGPANSFRCMCPVGMELVSNSKRICFLVKIHQCSHESGTQGSCGFSDDDLRGTSISMCPGNLVLNGTDGTCVCPEDGLVLDKRSRTCVSVQWVPFGDDWIVIAAFVLMVLTLIL